MPKVHPIVFAACVCIIAATGYYFIQETRGAIAAHAAAGEAHMQACYAQERLGFEQQDPRMVSRAQHCIAGIE